MRMLDLLNQIDAIVWGPWLLVLLVGTGVYLTIRLGFLQMVKLPRALRLIFFARNKGDGDIDSFKALCTALAATVGTGNIVGVATAIKLGGPGALFWMWVAAFFGMATKYAEGCLAVKFRSIDENGNIIYRIPGFCLDSLGNLKRSIEALLGGEWVDAASYLASAAL